MHASLLYRWRRELAVPADPVVDDMGFLPVTVALEDGPVRSLCEAPASQVPCGPPVSAVSAMPALLEVTLPGGIGVRMQGSVDPALAVSVLKALAAPGRCS